MLDCAAAHGFATLDTYPRIASEPRRLDLYRYSHMNPRGNQMVASLLAATLPALLDNTACPSADEEC